MINEVASELQVILDHSRGRRDELMDLLSDMLSDYALDVRLDLIDGMATPVWFTDCGSIFADRIIPMEDDANARRAELFLNGELVFTVERLPEPLLRWRTVSSIQTAVPRRPN